jgi:hypothetical protein
MQRSAYHMLPRDGGGGAIFMLISCKTARRTRARGSGACRRSRCPRAASRTASRCRQPGRACATSRSRPPPASPAASSCTPAVRQLSCFSQCFPGCVFVHASGAPAVMLLAVLSRLHVCARQRCASCPHAACSALASSMRALRPFCLCQRCAPAAMHCIPACFATLTAPDAPDSGVISHLISPRSGRRELGLIHSCCVQCTPSSSMRSKHAVHVCNPSSILGAQHACTHHSEFFALACAGFIGGTKSLEGAVAMARAGLTLT